MTAPTSPRAKAVLHLEDGDWQAAHVIVQRDSSPLAAWAIEMGLHRTVTAKSASTERAMPKKEVE